MRNDLGYIQSLNADSTVYVRGITVEEIPSKGTGRVKILKEGSDDEFWPGWETIQDVDPGDNDGYVIYRPKNDFSQPIAAGILVHVLELSYALLIVAADCP